jgi:hypothetical protein
MKAKFLGTWAAAGVLAGLALLPASVAAASTVDVTYNYVYFVSGPHQRQPRVSGSGGFVLINSQSGGQQTTNNEFSPGELPCTLTIDSTTDVKNGPPKHIVENYNFAFVSINGGSPTEGGPSSSVQGFDCQNAPLAYVGTAPINVLVVYVPAGGGGGGSDSGATIDSFDTTTGALFDDTFVSVAPDPSGALTKSGNVDGYVDTWNSAETITAISPTAPSRAKFIKWVILTGSTSTNAALAVAKQQSISALAFYQVPPPPPGVQGGGICYGPVNTNDCFPAPPGFKPGPIGPQETPGPKLPGPASPTANPVPKP